MNNTESRNFQKKKKTIYSQHLVLEAESLKGYLFLGCVGTMVPWPGMEPSTPAVETES